MKSTAEYLAHWAENPNVYVDKNNVEGDWLNKSDNFSWKPLWIMEEFYRYTTVVYTNENLPEGPTNFRSDFKYYALVDLISNVWFGEAEKLNHHCRRDNKTAIKIKNRLTGETLYIGFYDGCFTVGNEVRSEHEPIKLLED